MVDDVHHTVDALAQAEKERHGVGAVHGAAQGDEPFGHLHVHRGRAEPKRPGHHLLDDLLLDRAIPAQEDLDEIAAAQDSDQASLRVDDGEALDPVLFHHPGGVHHVPPGLGGDGRMAHQRTGVPCAARGAVAQEVGLGDHADRTPPSSTTGTAVTFDSLSRRAISLNVVPRWTLMTDGVIRSATVRCPILRPPACRTGSVCESCFPRAPDGARSLCATSAPPRRFRSAVRTSRTADGDGRPGACPAARRAARPAQGRAGCRTVRSASVEVALDAMA